MRGIGFSAPNTVPPGPVGVYGQGGSNADGVQGQSSSTTDSGVSGANGGVGAGVSGTSQAGYGGEFKGGLAQLHLTPSATTGHPVSGNHKAGEFYVDANGALFFCRSAGVPGTWVKLA